tara:strand:- start:9072 stop:9404 length:333 start_codon:yes stop_codon:yes gene_type:complete
MTTKDKVHVIIGIKTSGRNHMGTNEATQLLRETLGIDHSQVYKIMCDIESRKFGGSDYKTGVRMSYEQLGRYVAMRAELDLKTFWLWPNVIEVERPVPKKAHIFDISGAL